MRYAPVYLSYTSFRMTYTISITEIPSTGSVSARNKISHKEESHGRAFSQVMFRSLYENCFSGNRCSVVCFMSPECIWHVYFAKLHSGLITSLVNPNFWYSHVMVSCDTVQHNIAWCVMELELFEYRWCKTLDEECFRNLIRASRLDVSISIFFQRTQ